ncbi:hypothetical protein HpVa147_20720 [Helicobacter pylori]
MTYRNSKTDLKNKRFKNRSFNSKTDLKNKRFKNRSFKGVKKRIAKKKNIKSKTRL